jgi:hypothetical protein
VRTDDLYIYGELGGVAHLSEQDLRRFETIAARIPPLAGAALTIGRIERVFAVPGARSFALWSTHREKRRTNRRCVAVGRAACDDAPCL